MEQKENTEMIGYTDDQVEILTKKYSIDAFIDIIDKNMLQNIQSIYKLKHDGLDIIQFTRFFLNIVEHNQRQSLFLVAGLRNLFQNIAHGKSKILFSHITNFICEKILQKDTEFKQIEMKWIPNKSYQQKNNKYLKDPPFIKGGQIEQISKVGLGKLTVDKYKHQNLITQAYYSQCKKKIFILQSLSDWIGIYNQETKLQRKLRPSNFKVKKDSAVLKIGFSQREQRLGAILKDFSISFWDSNDNFQFQKSINTTKYCQDLQINIWYLQYFDKWLTADVYGHIYDWNLQNQCPQKHYQCKFKSKINDLCQIPANSLIAVIQQQKISNDQQQKLSNNQHPTIQLIDIDRGQIISCIDVKNQKRMLHTLKYSDEYQVLLCTGFEKKISLFQINNQFLDSTLKGEFLGHQSIVCCMNIIKKTPMIVSADDKGTIKIWNIKNFKCIQTLDLSNKVVITKLLDMSDQKKICILGSRLTLLYLQSAPHEIKSMIPLNSHYIQNSLIIFTPNDMRYYDINSGKVNYINCKFYQENNAQVSFVLILHNKDIVVGNQKGQIIFYSQNHQQNKIIQLHQNAIQYLEQDVINKLLISYSDQQGLIVSKLNDSDTQQLRSLKGNFIGRQLNSICFSSYHSIIAFICSSTVYICDYQQFKIVIELKLINEDPISLTILNVLGLFIIGTNLGNIYVYQLLQDHKLKFITKIASKRHNITHVIADMICIKDRQLQIQSCKIIASFQNGQIHFYDILSIAKNIYFKNSRINQLNYHPYKQIREKFFSQISKKQYQTIVIDKIDCDNRIISSFIQAHKSSVTSLKMIQFDEHFLVSTGMDNRVKIWRDNVLIGDTNINHSLPYLWNLKVQEKKKSMKTMIQGLELIQAIFKRFGKDVSLGQSQNLKFTQPIIRKDGRMSSKRKLQEKKSILFQDQFSIFDKNYDIAKKKKVIPVGGPSLKRMEVTKKFNQVQRLWQIQKQQQQKNRSQLLRSIQAKVIKSDENQTINMIFKQRINQKKRSNIQMNPFLLNLQEKLQKSLQKKQYYNKDSSRFNKTINISIKKGFQSSFRLSNADSYQSKSNLTNSNFYNKSKLIKSSSSNFHSLENSFENKNSQVKTFFENLQVNKKKNINLMLKNIKQKLQKSKKKQNKNLRAENLYQEGLFLTNYNKNRTSCIKFRHKSIVSQLDRQIIFHKNSQRSN